MARPKKSDEVQQEEVQAVRPKVTGKFYHMRGENGQYALVGPDGRLLSPFDMDEPKAADMAQRMQH